MQLDISVLNRGRLNHCFNRNIIPADVFRINDITQPWPVLTLQKTRPKSQCRGKAGSSKHNSPLRIPV